MSRRRKLGTQGSLFGDAGAEEFYIEKRAVSVPYGAPDSKGLYWYQKMAESVAELPEGTRDALLTMLLIWPAERMEAVYRLLNRWQRAKPLERDNFAEHFGR